MTNQLLLIGVVIFAITCGVRASLGRLLARRSKILAFVGSAVAAPLAIVVIAGGVALSRSSQNGAAMLFYGALILAGLALPLCFLASALTEYWLRPRGRKVPAEGG